MPLQQKTLQRRAGLSFDHGRNLPSFNKIYAFHHTQRFEWLRQKMQSVGKQSVSILELGCNDAISLDYVPVSVHRYLGFDAGWRSGWVNGSAYGLEAARQRYSHARNIEFRYSESCSDLTAVKERFDFGVVLETFEYLETAQLESYVAALADKMHADGCIFSTMPNEKGIPLLVKHFGSRMSGVQRSSYSLYELANAAIGRMDRVPRLERGRKGFDYESIAALVRRYFRHVYMEAVGPSFLPRSLSLNIGLVASNSPLRARLGPAPLPAILACEV